MIVKENIQKELTDATQMYIDLANEYYNMNLPMIPVSFNLKGAVAGQYCSDGEDSWFRYNLVLATENWDHYLAVTVPHEVAHYVQRQRFGRVDRYGRRVQPHGKEWKSIMKDCFQLKPDRCHTYNVTNARTKKTYKYACKCRQYDLTSIRHNKIRKGAQYFCKSCKGKLEKVED